MIKLEEKEILELRDRNKNLKAYMGKESGAEFTSAQMLHSLIAKCMMSDKKEDKVIGTLSLSELEGLIKNLYSSTALYERAVYRFLRIENKDNKELFEQFEKCLEKETETLAYAEDDSSDIEWIERKDETSRRIKEEYIDKKADIEAERIRESFRIV